MHWVRRGIYGAEVGAIIYLFLLLLNGTTKIDRQEILSVLILSVFIGWLTCLFECARLSYFAALGIHYMLTVAFIVCLRLVTRQDFSFSSDLLAITIIYAISYGITLLRSWLLAAEFNQQLKKIRRKRG